MVPIVLILTMLPPDAPLETSAISRVQTALSKVEAHVSAPGPILSVTENAALTRTLVHPLFLVVFWRLMCQQGCSSALPKAPKMTRRKITPSHRGRSSHGPNSGGVNLATNVNLNLGGLLDGLLGGSGLNLDVLINGLLKSLGIVAPVSGSQSSGLEAELRICIGADISGTQSLLGTITDVVNSLLSSLLGTTVKCKVEPSCSLSVNPHTISIDLQVCGLSGLSIESTLDKTLKVVANLLNGLLDGVNLVTNCSVGGSGCPATPALPSPSHPLPSPSTEVDGPHPSVSPSPPAGIDHSGLLNGASNELLVQVRGVLNDLGLSSGDYTLDTGADPIVGVSVGLNDTLGSIDGLVAVVITLVDETLDLLLATNVTVQTDLDQSSSSAPSHLSQGDGIVVDIDLGVVLDVTLSNTVELVDGVLSAVSGVLATLLDTDVAVNVDGGHNCDCSGSKRASATQ